MLGLPRKYANYSRARGRSFILLIALLSACDLGAAQTSAPELVTSDAESRVIALTNALRAKHGLQPVHAEARLTGAARAFAAYVAKTDNLDHVAGGTTPAERAAKEGYSHCLIAENLAYEYASAGLTADRLAQNILQGWSESPTHRANMLHADVTQIGIGIAGGKPGEYYAVQMLARPLSESVKFRVVNRTSTTIRYDFRTRGVAIAPQQTRNHQSCIHGELKMIWPGQQPPTTIRARQGAVYTISQSGNTFRLAEE